MQLSRSSSVHTGKKDVTHAQRETDLRSSCSGERETWDSLEAPPAKRPYLQIRRPEVVAPCADTVSLIDSQETDEPSAEYEN